MTRRTLQEDLQDPMRIVPRALDAETQEDVLQIKLLGETFFNYVISIAQQGGDNRNLALARTKIEEAVMWAIKGIT